MATVSPPLKAIFFPFMAHGHMLPMVDIANLFASRGVDTTIFTTPLNAALIRPSLNGNTNINVHLHVVPFPSIPSLPANSENFSDMMTTTAGHAIPLILKLFKEAVYALRAPFHQLLLDSAPVDCIVSDVFLPWTLDVADDLNIPRLVFQGTNFFSRCALHILDQLYPFDGNSDAVVIPGLPHKITLLKSQTDQKRYTDPMISYFFEMIQESEEKSYGAVVNSFYELEPDYADHYRNVIGRKAWHVGPVSLVGNRSSRANTGNDACDDVLDWLDGREGPAGSVVYVCFGSMATFTESHIRELALGVEASGCSFVWVVSSSSDAMLPEGFEERTRARGLVVRGWAPQTMILNHGAVGGFVTHCGWNSCLEGISAGLSMVTWPMFAEQFVNERLIVDLLKIGVSLGVKEYGRSAEEREVVEAGRIESAVKSLMGEEEEEAAVERRRRAKELGEAARRAVEVGGSSYVDMGNLMQELVDRRSS